MWSCWVGLCGVFVVGYELPLLWNNLLTPRKEIKRAIDPLWSIELRWQNVDVCKGFDEEVILEADLSIFVKPQQYTSISICSTIEIYTMKKIFPFSFGDTWFQLWFKKSNLVLIWFQLIQIKHEVLIGQTK
jgi:hypothetical protein